MGNVSTTGQALTYSQSGNQLVVQGLLTMSTSYAALGDAITARQLGLGFVQSLQIAPSTAGYSLTAVGPPTNGISFTILALKSGDISISAGTTASVQVRHVGLNTAGDTLISSASANLTFSGGGSQATAATDLSSVRARFRAEGF